MVRSFTFLLCLSVISLANAHAAEEGQADAVSIDDVRGIFEANCLSCHNETDLKGGLSLQSTEHLRRGGDSGEVIAAGAPELSYLLDLIEPDDEGHSEMPKGADPLQPAEIDLIRRWIADGATWPDNVELQASTWWAFRPLKRPAVPEVTSETPDAFPIRNPIDAFIADKHREHGLLSSPAADRRTLIRRLYSDLWGLPPTPEAIEEFVSDAHPLAYERLVDRLLQSPHYGERWARHWLDVVKYADTCGYDKDKLRPHAWPYRDYVIRSFNADKPYARFVQEQIAGDVIFPGTPDGILGLGFVAAGPWDFIGHVEVPESKFDGKVARHLDRDEMVTNTMNTFCSVTIQCAQCHDHKFDPFTQEHYYGLQAVFAAVDRSERPFDLDPQIERQRQELKDRLQLSREELATLEKEIRQAGGDQLTELDKRINELQPAITPKTKDPRFGYHSTISADPNEEKWVEVDLGMPQSIDRIALRPCHDDYAGIGAGFGFPVRFKVTVQLEDKGPWQTAVDQTKQDVPNPGLMPVEFSLKEVTARTIRITATQLAERKNDYIFAIAELQVFDAAGENIAIGKPVSAMDSIEAPVRWAKTNLTDGLFAQMADESRAREYAEATQERQSLLNKIETPERVRRRRTLKDDIAQAEKQLADLPSGKMVYAAATHFDARGNFHPTLGEPRAVHVLDRGNLQNPREVATPCTLPIIPEVDAILELPPNHLEGDRRRALAEWITRPDNPLTWRSVVNRIWQYHFGQGIVPSPNDFGRMGRLPSHSELLDWLAVEFRDNGQSWKHLHRLIVTSSTYRQQSTNQPENAEIDGSNRFLWRMNRRRLEAEEIRDAILTMSGRMNPEMGGPGYYLFELEKPEHSPHYEYHKFDADDAKSHRRSIYRFIVRSQPDPYMTTLDCADSSQSTPKREETVTALQALSLLNNDFNLTMSRHFARRLKQHSSTLDKQVTHGFQLTTGRPPTVEELTQLTRYAEQHGTENLCRILLNLNEFIYLD